MKIKMNANEFSSQYKFFSLEDKSVADFKPKTDNDGVVKTNDQGKQLYGINLIVLSYDENGQSQEKNVYVSIVNPVEIEAMHTYYARGSVKITHFEMNGRVSASIQIDSLVDEAALKN